MVQYVIVNVDEDNEEVDDYDENNDDEDYKYMKALMTVAITIVLALINDDDVGGHNVMM